MAVFKATENKKDSSTGTFKATKRKSYDSTMVYDWETKNKESTTTLKNYYDKINKGEYLSADDIKAYRSAVDSYIDSTSRLRGLNKSFGSNYSEDEEKEWTDYVTSLNTSYDSASKYYSTFKDEKAFKKHKEYIASDQYKLDLERQEGMKNFDLDAGKLEIEDLEKKASERESLKSKIETLRGQQQQYYSQRNTLKANEIGKQIAEYQAQYDAIGDIEPQLAEKRLYYRDAERIQTSSKLYDGAVNAEDFAEQSQYQSTKSDGWWDKLWSDYGLGYDDLTYEYINDVDGMRSEIKNQYINYSADNSYSDGESEYEEKAYDYIRDEEKAVYNYYYNTQGKEKANEYLDSIQPTLQYRRAEKIAENVEENNLQWAMALSAGLDQWETGLKGTWNAITGDETISDPTATQYASSIVRENIESDFLRGAYDLGVTMSNMLPSILVGSVTGSVGGLATMGVSVYGNAYTEMINLGYNKSQANSYATLTTAAELGLQSILGGYKAVGGKLSNGITEFFVSKVDHALAKLAIRGVGNMLGEGIEEALQSVLEPAFKSYVTGETYDVDWEEVLYSGILGALSAGILEGVPSVIGYGAGVASDVINTYSAGKEIKKSGNLNKLKSFASNTFSADTVAHKLAGKVDENTGAYKIGKLLNKANATLSEQNKADIVRSLERKGIKGKSAELYVNALAAVVEGYTLTEEQISALNADPAVAKTLVDVIINPNSTVNQRMQGYAEAINMVKSGGATNAETAQNQTNQNSSKNASIEAVTEENKSQESVYNYSADGKTIYNNEDVSVKEISSIKDGEVYVRLEDGREVNAKDVSFSTKEEALMYEMVADLGVTPETATGMMASYNKGKGTISAENFRTDGELAYKYGLIGYIKGLTNLNLTGDQKIELFGLGQKQAKKNAETFNNGYTKEKSLKFEGKQTKKNGVTYIGINPESITKDVQKASIIGAEILANSSNLDIILYESYRDENGNIVVKINGKVVPAPNGMFREGNRIYLDINAGNAQEGTILYTLSHEVGHYIRKWNKTAFKELGDFLFEHYEGDTPVKTLIDNEIENLKNQYKAENKKIPSEPELYDLAYEEVVCNALSKMFADENAYIKLAELKKQNQSLWAKIGEAIKAFLERLKEAIGIYSKYDPSMKNTAMTKDMATDVYNKLQDMYIKAFVEADANYSAINETLSNNGIMVNTDTESASLYSVRDLLVGKQQQQVAKALAERLDVTVEEAMDWLKAETSMASLILNPKYSQYLDYTADPNEVAIKQNSDYPQGTVDFSPICAKRREFTSVMNNILRLFPNHVFAATDLAKIRSIMQEEGVTIPCGICYVEDRRQLDTIVAQNFIDSLKLYREGSKTRPDGNAFNTNQLKGLKLTDGDSYTPSVYELVSLEGLNVLKEKNPNMAEAWVKFNNARGMQSVRLLANEAEYKRQILKYSKSTVKSKNDKGGLRVYSFSDAEMFHLIDIIQVITDSATVGLSLQGYTKVNEYAKTVKDTGEKLNRSLIPKGELGYHVEKGKVILDYDTVEGIDINHPDFFDNKDNPDVGNITIGVSDVQIRAAMVSDFVDQIIPFHTRQSEEVLGEKGIATWSNYKDFQTEKDISTGKVSDHQVNIYTEVLQVLEKEGKPITKRTFVEKYLQVCKENNLTPRFSQFLNTNEKGEYVYTEGYHKMLVDFKTFAQTEVGEYLPQKPVKPIFDNNYITKILKEYVKSQKVKDTELSKSMPKVIERITNEIVKPSDMRYSTRDSAGNQLSKEQQEFFKDSKVRDENGNLLVVYHGSPREFTVFDSRKITRGKYNVNYFTPDRSYSEGVGFGKNGKIYSSYLNIKNPYYYEAEGQKIGDLDVDSAYFNDEKKVYEALLANGYDGMIVGDRYNPDEILAFESNQIKETTNKTPTSDPDIRYSTRDLAPTFYSQMGKVVEGMKQDKFAANSIVPMLRGRGVKAEEIRWSGIVTWLENKKSVTKKELLDFITGSQLQIGEQMHEGGASITLKQSVYGDNSWDVMRGGELVDTYSWNEDSMLYESDTTGGGFSTKDRILEHFKEKYGSGDTRWDKYKLDGGKNYRELVFTMPNSSYSNRMMKTHWGEDADGVLVHARMQDFVIDGKKMLFIEEIQSDWHNAGNKNGYEGDAITLQDMKKSYEVRKMGVNSYNNQPVWSLIKKDDGMRLNTLTRETEQEAWDGFSDYLTKLMKKRQVPNAPFKDTYHEFVLKRLLRMAAEQGYDSIGWTPADIQVKRWSEEFAEAYRIEYDQEIPKFLKKYGRQWGAKVEHSYLNKKETLDDISFDDIQNKSLEELNNGTKVWSMDITDSMKDSVLHEGQTMYSLRESQNGLANEALSPYDDELKGFIEKRGDYIVDSFEKLKQIVNLAFDNPQLQATAYFGIIDVETLEKIKNSIPNLPKASKEILFKKGRDYSIAVTFDSIRHMVDDKKGLTREDVIDYLDRLADTIIDFDTVTFSLYKKNERGLLFKKEFSDGLLASYNLISNRSRSFVLQSLYIDSGDYIKKKSAETLMLQNATPHTPKASVGQTSDITISQNSDSVKDFSENSQKNSVRDPKDQSNRSLLANALESVAKEGEERNLLRNYKTNIRLMEAEEVKLAKVKKEANKLRLTKGKTDAENNRLKKLEEEVKAIEARINKYDRQLLKLEANSPLKAVLEREKANAYKEAAQKGREDLAKYREKATKNALDIMKHYQESRAKSVEGRHKTVVRNQLKKTVAELKRLLEKGTKERNVKIGLQESVAKALDLADILLSDEYTNEAIARHGVESVTDAEAQLLEQYNALLDILDPYKAKLDELYEERKELKKNKATDAEIDAVNAKIEAIRNNKEYARASRILNELNHELENVFVRERNNYNKANATSVMDGLIAAYESLKDSEVDYIRNAYQDELLGRLKSVRNTFKNVSIKDMSLKDLQDIYKAYSMVKHVVTDANKIFREGRKEDLGKRIEAVQSELRAMGKERKDRPALFDKVAGWIRSFSWNNLRPVDAFERLGVKSFTELFWDAVEAQDTYSRDVVEAGEVISKAREKYKYKKWDLKTAKNFKTTNGLEFKLTLGDIMSIYAYSFRDQAFDHMTIGGFTFDTGKTYKEKKHGVTKVHAKLSDTYIVSEAIIQDIINSLTEEQRAYVEEIQNYLTKLGEKGNEVARILYGIDIFTEEHYFPLQSEKDYRSSVEQAFNSTQTMVSLKNTGMTKATVPHANNPIVLKSFDDVILDHVDKMSKYHAFVIPIENMQKVFNNAGQDVNQTPISTQALISSIFGREATAYFNQYITDLNGGGSIGGARNPLSSFFGKAKGVSVAANLSVVAQQYFAVVRAMAEIDVKYFIPFLNRKASKSEGSSYEELKKYAPVAVLKEMGGFDIGSNRGAKDYIGMENAPVDGQYLWKKFQDATMFGASLMDRFGWITIWKAVKKEIASTRPDLVIGSDEFFNACRKRFNEVVTRTQVYDSVNSRSGFMRSKHDSVKYLTSFMGEPTTSIGMYFTSVNNFIRALKSKDKAEMKTAKRRFARTLATLPIAGALTAMSKALIQAMRDDDEDESYAEKWVEHYTSNFKEDLNPLNFLPVFRDIMSVIEGWDVERPDMTLIADLVTATEKMFDEDADAEDVLNALGAFGNILGIPLKNVIRDVRGFINTIKSSIDGEKTTSAGIKIAIREGFTGEEISNKQQLYEAYLSDDKEQIKRVEGRFEDKSDIEAALRKALRENDPRIKEAAQAVIDGNHAERIRLTREIVAEGHFRQDIVVAAINAEINAIRSELKKTN